MVLGVKKIKNVTQEEAFAADKPRKAYWNQTQAKPIFNHLNLNLVEHILDL